MLRLILALLCWLMSAPAWAVIDLYVDTNSGSDANACTASGASACSTLSGAVGKIPGSITDAYVIHCTGSVADTTAVTIASKGSTATNTITIQVDTANRHAGTWDASKYHLQADLGTATSFITVQEPYVRIVGLQIYQTNVGNANQGNVLVDTVSSGNLQISKTIFRGARYAVWAYAATGHTTYVWNVVAYGFDTNGGLIIVNNGDAATVYSSTSGGTSTQDFRIVSGTLAAKNCYASTYLSASTITTSAASDATGEPGTTLDNVAYSTANFTNVTSGSEDLHLVAGSVMIDNGTDTSGESAPLNFTDDITGTARTGTWEVGAFTYAPVSNQTFGFRLRLAQ